MRGTSSAPQNEVGNFDVTQQKVVPRLEENGASLQVTTTNVDSWFGDGGYACKSTTCACKIYAVSACVLHRFSPKCHQCWCQCIKSIGRYINRGIALRSKNICHLDKRLWKINLQLQNFHVTTFSCHLFFLVGWMRSREGGCLNDCST